MKFVLNGPDVYPGAKIYEKKNGDCISLRYVDRESIKLEEGDKVHRHILDGDAVLFNFKTVHCSTGNNTSRSRRAFSMRFIGDDIKYIDRGGPTSPPFDGINLKTGDLMRDDWFPKVFSS